MSRVVPADSLAIVTIWQEGEGEPYQAKVAIGEAIRNRMRLKYDSDGTVEGTVARRKQFSAFNDDPQDNARFIKSLRIDSDDAIVQDCARAWFESETSNLTAGAVLYFNPRDVPGGKPAWDFSQLVNTGTFGNQEFYALRSASQG